jgi:hypothetical protein
MNTKIGLFPHMKIVGFSPPLIGFLVIFILLVFTALIGNDYPFLPAQRIVDLVISFGFGIHCVMLCTIEIENKYEFLFATHKSISGIFIDRYLTCCLFWFIVGLLGTALTSFFTHTLLTASSFLSWACTGIFISSIGLSVLSLTHQSIFSILIIFIIWVSMYLGGDSLIRIFPFLQPLHIFLNPFTVSWADYLINRVTTISLGLLLLAASYKILRNVEKLLLK